jgi:hypothetical protein
MKKLVLTSMAMVLGAVLAHAQGTITLATTAATVNLSSNSVVVGNAAGTGWSYEVLDMTSSAYLGLSANQQAAAYNLLNNNSAFSLWTDSTVTGAGNNLHAGGIAGNGNATANNWAAPATAAGYSTAPSYDYYTVVGWNNALGNWAAVQAFLNAGTLASQNGWFGQSATVAYNYAGGGTSGLAAVDVWGASGTGLAGSGGVPTVAGLTLQAIPTPEPTTLALAGLGGISMLFLRRRKA